MRQFGTNGSGVGQLSAPYGITTDPSSGALYVADHGNNRIEEFAISGQEITTFGSKGKENGQLEGPEGTAATAAGDIYVADANNRIEQFEAVPPPLLYAGQFGTVGTEPGKMKEPRAVLLNAAGNLLVLGTGNSRIEEYTTAGVYTKVSMGALGSGNGQLATPFAMAQDASGDIWVADTGNDRIEEFSAKGEYEAQFGKAGAGEGQFAEPKGIAVTPGGNIFVADGANNRIEKFNNKGVFQEAFGWGVSNGESKFEVCTSACKAGSCWDRRRAARRAKRDGRHRSRHHLGRQQC